MLHSMQVLTIILGVATVALSFVVAFKFISTHQELGRAYAATLIGEGVLGAATVFFAITSLIGVYGSLSPWVVMGVRWGMFAVSSATTVHLYVVVRKL